MKLRLVLTVDRLLRLSESGKIELTLPDGKEMIIVLPEGCKAKVLMQGESGNWIEYPKNYGDLN